MLTIKDILNAKYVITHSEMYHSDDLFCYAFLKSVNPDLKLIRCNNVPESFDGTMAMIDGDFGIVVDIGRGMYDHHQENNECRSNGIPYASFGKLWRDLGPQIYGESIANYIDAAFVQTLDLTDNTGKRNPLSTIIANTNLLWNESVGTHGKENENIMTNADERFHKHSDTAMQSFMSLIEHAKALEESKIISKVTASIQTKTTQFHNGTFNFKKQFSNLNFILGNTSFYTSKELMNAETLIVNSKTIDANKIYAIAVLQIANPSMTICFDKESPRSQNSILLDDIALERTKRKNNIPYSTFGAIYDCISKQIFNTVNAIRYYGTGFVQWMDLASNGISNPLSVLIDARLEQSRAKSVVMELVHYAKQTITREQERERSNTLAENLVNKQLESVEGDVLILDKYMPWTAAVMQRKDILFVVSPYLRGGYMVQPVKESFKKQDYRIPFPEILHGKEESRLNSIIPGMTFCHSSGFLSVFDTLDHALNGISIIEREYVREMERIINKTYSSSFQKSLLKNECRNLNLTKAKMDNILDLTERFSLSDAQMLFIVNTLTNTSFEMKTGKVRYENYNIDFLELKKIMVNSSDEINRLQNIINKNKSFESIIQTINDNNNDLAHYNFHIHQNSFTRLKDRRIQMAYESLLAQYDVTNDINALEQNEVSFLS